MNNLDYNSILEKIKSVERDISKLEREENSIRKMEILKEYKSYLEDELKNMQNDNRS